MNGNGNAAEEHEETDPRFVSLQQRQLTGDARVKVIEETVVAHREESNRRHSLVARGLRDVTDGIVKLQSDLRAFATNAEHRHSFHQTVDDNLTGEVNRLETENKKHKQALSILRAALPTSNIAIIVSAIIAQVVVHFLTRRLAMWEAILKIVSVESLTVVWLIGSIVVPLMRTIMKPAEGSPADKIVSVIEGLFVDLAKIIKSLTGNSGPKSLPPGGDK